MQKYKVKEIFFSLQGEGHYAGTPSVFCRFSGCNLWSGLEKDRTKSVCSFCDTDFVGGTSYTEDNLVEEILGAWPEGGRPRVVFTGGEPLLQLKESLIDKLKKANFDVAVETNGTKPLPACGPYWVTVSPKTEEIVVSKGHELKVLFPNKLTPPESFEALEFDYFFIQPIADSNYESNLKQAVQFVMENPKWRLSLQQHKVAGIR